MLECYDAAGNKIGDYTEIVEAYKQAEARVLIEARADAEGRMRAMEEELRRLRGAAT